MIEYNFNVKDPDELREIIWKLSLDITDLRKRIDALEAKCDEEK